MVKKVSWVLLILVSCAQIAQEEALEASDEIKYASTFHIERSDTLSYLIVDEPWPNALEKEKYQLGTPYQRIVCTSTSHLPYFELLGIEDLVVGFPNTTYISSEVFRKRVEAGLLTDLGPDGAMNMELLLSLNADLIIAFDMGGEAQTLNKISKSGIPVAYNADFLETSPLGRAEWIKFFGNLFDRKEQADSIFNAIETEYLRLENMTKTIDQRPSILSGVVYGDTWFLPGGKNWSASFFDAAGGEYLWSKDTVTGWMELSFEAVFDKARSADYWIGTSTLNSKSELLGQENRYELFAAFSNDQVFNYSKKRSPEGGYDFFESGYARPDLVLADLINILHPTLLPDHERIYFEQLK